MDFTKEEFDRKLKQIYKDLTYGIDKPVEKKAFLLGGQPGAGKSGLTSLLEAEFDNLIVVTGDDFRKEHPHYLELEKKYGKKSVEYTKSFAGKMTEALITKLSDEGYSLIIEGTLRTAATPLKTAKELLDKGYKVEMTVILVRPEYSYLRTIARYEEMIKTGLQPRATLKKDHQVVVDNIASNLTALYEEKIFSNIRVFNKNGDCLYSLNETPDLNPAKLFEEEFNRVLTEDEKIYILEKYKGVFSDMKARNASEEELNLISSLMK